MDLPVQGPLRAGYATDLWTLGRVIHCEFGIRYHPAHMWKLLTGPVWSSQKRSRAPWSRARRPSPG